MTEAERLRAKIMSLFVEYFAGTISVKIFKREVLQAGREWLAAAKIIRRCPQSIEELRMR